MTLFLVSVAFRPEARGEEPPSMHPVGLINANSIEAAREALDLTGSQPPQWLRRCEPDLAERVLFDFHPIKTLRNANDLRRAYEEEMM
jgi:hypothetical protein